MIRVWVWRLAGKGDGYRTLREGKGKWERLGKRDEGISRKRDINLFPLLPFPLSLTVKAKPLRHAEEKTTRKMGAVRDLLRT